MHSKAKTLLSASGMYILASSITRAGVDQLSSSICYKLVPSIENKCW
jgi:hypothetical protein